MQQLAWAWHMLRDRDEMGLLKKERARFLINLPIEAYSTRQYHMHLLQPEHFRASQITVQTTIPCTVRHRMASCGIAHSIAGHCACRASCRVPQGITLHRMWHCRCHVASQTIAWYRRPSHGASQDRASHHHWGKYTYTHTSTLRCTQSTAIH